jgi:hypothetical protein
MLPQNQVEEILHDRLAAEGHTVGYGTELVTFAKHRDEPLGRRRHRPPRGPI